MIYPSFVAWVEAAVIPLQQANPTWHRLDGRESGGNRAVVARFQHQGQTWQVHGDTRFGPVMRAYEAITAQQVADPFIVEWADRRNCLNLVESLRGRQRPKHFYVYEQI
jgi:hypothetical protein